MRERKTCRRRERFFLFAPLISQAPAVGHLVLNLVNLLPPPLPPPHLEASVSIFPCTAFAVLCFRHISFAELKKSLPTHLSSHQIKYLKKVIHCKKRPNRYGWDSIGMTFMMFLCVITFIITHKKLIFAKLVLYLHYQSVFPSPTLKRYS